MFCFFLSFAVELWSNQRDITENWSRLKKKLSMIIVKYSFSPICNIPLVKCWFGLLLFVFLLNYNRVTRILAHTLGGNLKSFCKVNQKFQLFLGFFFFIPRHTKGTQAVGQNHTRIGAYRVVCVVLTLCTPVHLVESVKVKTCA